MRLLKSKRANSRDDLALGAGPLCEDPYAEHLLRTGAYCKVLQDASTWQHDAVATADRMMRDEMAFVPAGSIELQNIAVTDIHSAGCGSSLMEQDHYFIDRTTVTNAQFKRFTDADAYRDQSFWPIQIQPHIFQFVDQTGLPGPASWRDGRYDPDKRDHPVVGISWHEASAFANWIGKRLPTSAQWQRAGLWWNDTARYPWGPSYEEGRANTFSAGHHQTVPVTEYSHAATPNGILQLVGNVWEWVDACFKDIEFDGRIQEIEAPLAEIRGGAFDTYLPSQASCLFRSGQALLARNHNVGFRCVASSALLAQVSHEAEEQRGS